MKIYSIKEEIFGHYGKILTGYDPTELLAAMRPIAMPDSGVAYEPSINRLEACNIAEELSAGAFGGMPIQIGMCWGYNTKLNCLEYHRNSEINVTADEIILLLARQDEIVDGQLNTSKVVAFRVPAETAVELYATTLHYAPCHTDPKTGFRTAVVLPWGTNMAKPVFSERTEEDRRLMARNKWVLAHALSNEAAEGAYVGLTGENIDIAL